VQQGEFVAILGPSGCGKSTLLRILSGLDQASSGEFFIHEHDNILSNVAMVFQEHGLFPWMTLRKNITFILENQPAFSGNKEKIESTASQYLSITGLAHYQDYLPHQVSGGMKQRISIARSFATDPSILLMDEPFVFLDYQTRFLLHELLLDIWQGSNKTILFVTHDIEEAILLADRIVVMSPRPATIILDEKINISRPRDLTITRKLPEFIEKVDEVIQLIRNDLVI